MLKNTGKLAGRTAFISGASRGIGREIALKLAKDKANIIIAAKTAEAHPKLPGTIYTVAKEIEAAGGKALPCIVDIRDEKQVLEAVAKGAKEFGGIDICINNASAISLTKTVDTEMKKYDLMHQINGRGTFLVSKACIPYLKNGKNPHILNLSPPLNLSPQWFMNHVAYTMAKYNMSMCALGMAEELKSDGIASNCIWPRTAIFTAAMEMIGGGKSIQQSCRKPEMMADSAYAILCRDSKTYTGNFCIDEDVLREEGITDFSPYEYGPPTELMPDFFLDEKCQNSIHSDQYAIIGKGQSASSAPPPSKAPKADSGSAAGKTISPDSDIGKLVATIKSAINDEIVNKTKAIFQFDVTGDKGGRFYLDLKNAPGSIGHGEPPAPNKADVVLTLKDNDFIQVFTGKVNPTTAYMTGKLKMKGDITKAMVLDKLMGKLKPKL